MSKVYLLDVFLPFSDINKTGTDIFIFKSTSTYIPHDALGSFLNVERESKFHESYIDNIDYFLEVLGTTVRLIMKGKADKKVPDCYICFRLKQTT